jgi:hypothetical protein
MKAVEFARIFERGEEITKYLDLSKAKRSRSKRLETSPDGIDLGKGIIKSTTKSMWR